HVITIAIQRRGTGPAATSLHVFVAQPGGRAERITSLVPPRLAGGYRHGAGGPDAVEVLVHIRTVRAAEVLLLVHRRDGGVDERCASPERRLVHGHEQVHLLLHGNVHGIDPDRGAPADLAIRGHGRQLHGLLLQYRVGPGDCHGLF